MNASWLVLERYALGECGADEAREVEDALTHDPDARAILAAIRSDVRALPPLPVRRSRTPFVAAVLALAAATLVVVGLRGPAPDGAIKGGSLSLELVRSKDGLALPTADVAVGETLGLRLTCPPGRRAIDVVVFQGDASFPIERATVSCGNRVAIPGAFSVDAPGSLVACVAVGDLPARAVLATGPHAADVCVEAVVRR